MLMSSGSGLKSERNGGTVAEVSWPSTGTLFTAMSIFDGANNTLYRDNSAGTPVANTAAFGGTANRISLFDVNPYQTWTWKGDVAEIVFWDSALGSTDRSTVHNNQRDYWGTP
jgi:hypothetical protein